MLLQKWLIDLFVPSKRIKLMGVVFPHHSTLFQECSYSHRNELSFANCHKQLYKAPATSETLDVPQRIDAFNALLL